MLFVGLLWGMFVVRILGVVVESRGFSLGVVLFVVRIFFARLKGVVASIVGMLRLKIPLVVGVLRLDLEVWRGLLGCLFFGVFLGLLLVGRGWCLCLLIRL